MELSERDFRVFREVERWRFCLGRHIQFLAGFSSQRTCDRRLRKLLDEGFLERKLILYGVPSVYMLTRKSRSLIYANQREEKIKLDQIMHDITVLDVAICFIKFLGLKPNEIKTEKQLHQTDGFGERQHQPDFVFSKDNQTYCVEVELSLKAKTRLEKNIRSNFLAYDIQIWVTDEDKTKLVRILEDFKAQYPNMKITNVEEVKNNEFRFNI
ncbi:MAG: hypothetical protein FWG82_00455 [Oscillospiraceae bacterium]|nr:hypothetical protein [Oscillospiraceae bacterium]